MKFRSAVLLVFALSASIGRASTCCLLAGADDAEPLAEVALCPQVFAERERLPQLTSGRGGADAGAAGDVLRLYFGFVA